MERWKFDENVGVRIGTSRDGITRDGIKKSSPIGRSGK